MATYDNAPQVTRLLGTANTDGTFTGVTTGTSTPLDPGQSDQVTFAVIGNGTIASGTVILEEAYSVPGTTYAGTWSTLVTITASTLTGNAQQVVHYSPNAMMTVRARIGTSIGGGGGITVIAKAQ